MKVSDEEEEEEEIGSHQLQFDIGYVEISCSVALCCVVVGVKETSEMLVRNGSVVHDLNGPRSNPCRTHFVNIIPIIRTLSNSKSP